MYIDFNFINCIATSEHKAFSGGNYFYKYAYLTMNSDSPSVGEWGCIWERIAECPAT